VSKTKQLETLYGQYRNEFAEQDVVLGDGNTDAKLLLIGEAPGKDEVRLGRPFVGIAGKNLNEFLGIMEIQRESIYITNAIKYRLSKVNPHTGKVVNRPALTEEINKNREYLFREIEIICPDYLVTLGNVPLKAVTAQADITIGSVHGRLITAMVSGREYSLFPLYHPASIIYNQSLKEVYLNDIKRLKKVIDK